MLQQELAAALHAHVRKAFRRLSPAFEDEAMLRAQATQYLSPHYGILTEPLKASLGTQTSA